MKGGRSIVALSRGIRERSPRTKSASVRTSECRTELQYAVSNIERREINLRSQGALDF